MSTKTLAALLIVASSATAVADTYELGARVGGYGFRREGANQDWTECRMNGLGVFAGRALPGPLFAEAGLDLYSSVAPETGDLPIDRTSGLVSAAVGARTQIASWLRGYVQLGGGLELTRVSVPYGDDHIRDSKAMPEGFFGLGFDIELVKGTRIGSTFRTLVMGNFDYDPANLEMKDQWALKPSSDVVFDATPDVATQVQFYVRRDL